MEVPKIAVVEVVVVLSVVLVSSLVAVVVLSLDVAVLSSLLAHEMTVRLKRNMMKMMSICLTEFPISRIRLTQYIPLIGMFYKNAGSLREYSLVILDVSETLF